MDKRINAAAAAFPKLEPLIEGFLRQSPVELACSSEELFYETGTRDIYIALTFSALTDSSVSQLVVHVPHHIDGTITVIDAATLLELDLEDITHLIPTAIIQVLRNQYTVLQLKSALHTSVMLTDICIQPDFRLDGLAARRRQKSQG